MEPQERAAAAALDGVGLTALIVAQARAAESGRPDRLFDDPLAQAFVAAAGPAFAAAVAPLGDLLTVQSAYVAIRTRFFDDCLLAAADAGCRQVVVLGAGLETRAFRLAWPPAMRLFELDLPAMIEFKERVLDAQSAQPTCERFVVRADLREEWPTMLAAAGHRADQPTAWLAEGLMMYLGEADRDRLLVRLGALSAPGSWLGLDHRGPVDRDRPPGSGDTRRPSGPSSTDFGDRAGESPVARLGIQMPVDAADPSLMDPDAWLAGHGWGAVVYPPAEAFVRYGRPVPPALAAVAVRLWLASASLIASSV
jgi:methyltransferase (TIGR00027 family)